MSSQGTVSASFGGSVDPVKILNNVNLVVSVGLLALGIVLIIYGFEIPDKKCDSKTQKNCIVATKKNDKGVTKTISETVVLLRLVALITGFLLIIPFALNIAEMALSFAPGTGGLTNFLGKIGSVADQRAYSMKSRHHGGMHNMHHGGHMYNMEGY